MLSLDEKKQVLLQDQSLKDQTKGTTFSALSSLDPKAGGRFAALADTIVGHLGKPATVTIWEHDGVEPPLGWSVETQEPNGTPAEIEASRRLSKK
jgi:hypothetical protein